MRITRRTLLRQIAGGAAVAAAGPGPSLLAAETAGRRDAVIRLNKNENAYGPSAKAIAAMQEAVVSAANRHPDVDAEALRARIAAVHMVSPERVVLGCGSTEIMRMAVNAFVGRDKNLILASPTHDAIAGFAESAGSEVVSVALTKDYAHDLRAMRAGADARTGLVYLCNPNNPTGTLTPREEIEAFVQSLPATTHVLIDEAYHHYVGRSRDYASFIDRPLADERVIVVRTFSKIYGLAGLRAGYAVAAPAAAQRLASYSLPGQVNIVAAKAALAALDDGEHVMTSAGRNADDRQEFFNQANARMVRAIDSQANFVMLNTARPAAEIVEHFRKNNILLASPPFAAFPEHVRVSLGTAAELGEFWRVWDLMPHKMVM